MPSQVLGTPGSEPLGIGGQWQPGEGGYPNGLSQGRGVGEGLFFPRGSLEDHGALLFHSSFSLGFIIILAPVFGFPPHLTELFKPQPSQTICQPHLPTFTRAY